MTLRSFRILPIIAAVLSTAALEPGELVPGPFQAYMATGPRAGRFHSPITEFDLSPGVMVFVREGADFEKPVIDLLKKLDVLVPKYIPAKLGATAIVLGDGGYRKAIEAALEDKQVTDLTLTGSTLAKEAKEAKLRDLAKRENLQHVTLGFADAAALSKYGLDPNAEVNVLFVNQHKLVSKGAYPKGAMTEQDASKLLQQVETTADAVAKASRKR
jgi:hypothetical protein